MSRSRYTDVRRRNIDEVLEDSGSDYDDENSETATDFSSRFSTPSPLPTSALSSAPHSERRCSAPSTLSNAPSLSDLSSPNPAPRFPLPRATSGPTPLARPPTPLRQPHPLPNRAFGEHQTYVAAPRTPQAPFSARAEPLPGHRASFKTVRAQQIDEPGRIRTGVAAGKRRPVEDPVNIWHGLTRAVSDERGNHTTGVARSPTTQETFKNAVSDKRRNSTTGVARSPTIQKTLKRAVNDERGNSTTGVARSPTTQNTLKRTVTNFSPLMSLERNPTEGVTPATEGNSGELSASQTPTSVGSVLPPVESTRNLQDSTTEQVTNRMHRQNLRSLPPGLTRRSTK
jgi:hypothetical protein